MSSRVRTEIKLLALLAYVPIRYVEDFWFDQWFLHKLLHTEVHFQGGTGATGKVFI